MTQADLIALHTELTTRARDLMKKKNSDYAGNGNVFGNLDLCEAAGLCMTEVGILIRIGDKFSRCANLTKRDAAVLDESFEDSLLDIINYAVLCIAKRRTRSGATAWTPSAPSLTAASWPSSTNPAAT